MYAQMIGTLQAEEHIALVDVTAAGSGQMRRGDFRQFVSRLQRVIRRGRREPVRKATEEDLKRMGLIVERDDG